MLSDQVLRMISYNYLKADNIEYRRIEINANCLNDSNRFNFIVLTTEGSDNTTAAA